MSAHAVLRVSDGSADLSGGSSKPLTVRARPHFCGFPAFHEHLRLLIETGELLDVAAFGPGIIPQIAEPLLFRPATGHGERAVRIARSHNARQDPARLVQGFLDRRPRLPAEAHFKISLPYFRGRVCVIAHPSENLEKMP